MKLILCLLVSLNLYAVDYEPDAAARFPEEYTQFKNINLIAESIFSAQMPPKVKLEIVGTFEINAPIAAANFENNVFSISLFSGFARGAHALPGTQLLVLCHELGHFLAGSPKKISPEGEIRWSSAEGQADYYSGGDCLLTFFKNPYIYSLVKTYENNHVKYCSQFFTGNKLKLCSIGLTLAENYADIIETPYEYAPSGVSIYQQDTHEVESTLRGNSDYPTPQCRLDTIKAGLLNALDKNLDKKLTERPACWYKKEEG